MCDTIQDLLTNVWATEKEIDRITHKYGPQHANEDVEKMILGNKSDMEDKRVVSTEKGEAVSILIIDT